LRLGPRRLAGKNTDGNTSRIDTTVDTSGIKN
jgi:hypothetical protein